MDNERKPSDEEENERELLRKLLEQQQAMQERMKLLEKELHEEREVREEREEELREVREEHRHPRPEDEEDGKPEYEVRIERAAEGLERTIGDYVSSIMGSVADSLEGALDGMFSASAKHKAKHKRMKATRSDKAISKMISKRGLSDKDREAFPGECSEVLGVLADANRLKILQELELRPDYQKDLSERTGIKGGQWKHHTDLLKEAGFIDQEAVRGRYLITQLGREALKLAEMLYIRKKIIEQESASNTEESDEEGGFEVSIT